MDKRKTFWFTRAAVFALSLAVFAACDDDTTGPDGDLDPATAAATMDEVVARFVTGNEALQSLSVFTNLIISAPLGPDIVPLSALPQPGDGLVGWADRLRSSVTQLGGSEAVANIPVAVLGSTFVYNPLTEQYELDESRTDAPANGVRFVLYAVNPILLQPIEPLQEIGYLDITDSSSLPTLTIGMEAVINEVPLIQMNVTGTYSETAADLSYTGFLSDGEGELEFGIDAEFSQDVMSLDFEASFGIYTVSLSFGGNELLSTGTITAGISDADDAIEFTISVANDAIQDGSGVTINGDPVAIISGTLENPTITNGIGDPLTEGELQALAQLFEGIGHVFELFFELFIFGTLLLTLAFV